MNQPQIYRPVMLAIVSMALLGVTPAFADTACGSFEDTIGDIAGLASYQGTGCFNADNNEQVFHFSLTSDSLLNLYTNSWATGGFSPILTLFDGSGVKIAVDHGGVYSSDPTYNTCGSRGIGTADGESTCLDAFIDAELTAGNYTLVLTEGGNCANCGNFATGNYTGFPDPNYARYNTPNFTGFEWYGTGSTLNFLSPNNGDPLSGNWSVQIDNVSPEPGSVLLGLTGVLMTFFVVRRRRGERAPGLLRPFAAKKILDGISGGLESDVE